MTAILREIRRLEAARDSGALSETEFEAERAKLLAEVEDVEVDVRPTRRPQTVTVRPPSAARPAGRSNAPSLGMFEIILIGVALTALLALVSTLLIGDLTLALTLTVTVMAAVLVAAFRRLEL